MLKLLVSLMPYCENDKSNVYVHVLINYIYVCNYVCSLKIYKSLTFVYYY